MASRERSVTELLEALEEDKDGRKKYPFEYWERIDFQRYCKKFNIRNRPLRSKKFIHWFMIYEHYKRYKLNQKKKFRFILDPKVFLEMLRYFYIAKDEQRMKFNVFHSGKFGYINVKKAQKENRTRKTKARTSRISASDCEE